jgi:RNA polymerase sigma-32 factor
MAQLSLEGSSERTGLSHYLGDIRRFPMLSQEEEEMLARRWRDKADVTAAHRLITSHLRLVARVVRDYRGYGLPSEDLIAEGNLGLMRSLARFDPDRGFRLATYAMWWIRAAIQEYILRSWSLVKLGTTAAQKKLFFNLRRIKAELEAIESGDLSPNMVADIAKRLNVAEEDVVNMNRRLSGPDHSLNVTVGPEGDEEWLNWLVESRPDQETAYGDREESRERRRLLEKALKDLSERERRIVSMRRLNESPATLEVLSREYGISRERVRQIEVQAVEKLKRSVRAGEWRASEEAEASIQAARRRRLGGAGFTGAAFGGSDTSGPHSATRAS